MSSASSAQLAPPPFRTPLLADQQSLINQPVWVRWLTSVVLALNGATALLQTDVAANPNSAVFGSVGNLYTSTTDGSVWKKTSGTNTNTGWVLV